MTSAARSPDPAAAAVSALHAAERLIAEILCACEIEQEIDLAQVGVQQAHRDAASAIAARTVAPLLADIAALRTRVGELQGLLTTQEICTDKLKADRDRLAEENARLKTTLDQSWRRVIGYPFGQVCKHLVASNMLGDMEDVGFVISTELARAVVGADDATALAAPPLEYAAARALTATGGTTDDPA